ncbi:hypothetical protein CAOG_003155 [Capsaspora owczarzaki ATCC 30864]|uniref:Ubiquitin-like protease family profile domain-containing protein n=2 Tax=Capsaspora owczarzaki (strain ATCC 30864) TaxID=595528 RepID=A0A0D2VP32_CAPO3|nr:hypothetical protein CAOG_003155 [Capsaspora owczarzaki ATCC 30864]
MSDSDSPAILSYHNTLLLRSDLDLLSAGEWLNDRLIGFAFEYLEFQVLPSASSACSGQASPDLASRILLVGPDVAFLLANMDPDQAAGILASLDAPSRELVLLPVNNNRNVEAAGGSHWSLLVVDCSSQRLFHIDSAEGSNMSSAKSLARILRSVLGISAKVPVRAMPCPQQHNCTPFDRCVFVLLNAASKFC